MELPKVGYRNMAERLASVGETHRQIHNAIHARAHELREEQSDADRTANLNNALMQSIPKDAG